MDDVICPYCDHEELDAWEFMCDLEDGGTVEHICLNCDRGFLIEVSISYYFEMKKMEEEDDGTGDYESNSRANQENRTHQ